MASIYLEAVIMDNCFVWLEMRILSANLYLSILETKTLFGKKL